MKFEFETDTNSQVFCEAIANEMARLFGIPLDEAIGRINKHWKAQSFIGMEEMIYHEEEQFWVREIYFDHLPQWWTVPNPKPRSFP